MKRKLYPCMVCGTLVPIRSKGKCPPCREKERRKEGTLPIYKNSIKPITDKTKIQRKEERSCLALFFDLHIKRLEKKPFSMESGKRISEPSSINVCHIIDKGRHKSIQCHLENAIYLTWDEHNRMDKLLFEHRFADFKKEFPKSFPLYVKKYQELRKLVTEKTKFLFSFDEFIET